mmetsp:Transcript_14725/g.30041  ORF Transcript_14725/g.30041 Transcript_14725/m.30041 type:complete len:103 (+) Transcript_14725:85-393(+)
MFVTWAMARLKEQWGEDCALFKPERFISDGCFTPPKGTSLPVFLAGPRLCLGKDMAMLSSSIMLLSLLDRFDCTGGEDVDYTYEVGLTLWALNGMPLKFEEK